MKVDVAKIPNYEALPEEARKAIEAMEFSDAPDMTQFVSKAAFDKKATEAAELGKKLRERMSEEERGKQEQADKLADMERELNELRRGKTESEYTAKYVSLGFEAKLAQETAKAMADGDMATVFANISKANEALVKNAIAEKLKSTPRGVGGSSGNVGEDYAKAISEANARGDIAAVAYYTRLQAEAGNQNRQ